MGLFEMFKRKEIAELEAEAAKEEQQAELGEVVANEQEASLHFTNLNFKLAIIEVLMYDLQLLQPQFDIYDFAASHPEEDIDTDSDTVIEAALNFFRHLPIPQKLAPYVEEIYMDGGNEVYMNIIPLWDGEDECFNLNSITTAELQQFPNLKQATIMSNNFTQVKEVFEEANIEVQLL